MVADVEGATGGAIVEGRVIGKSWRIHFVADGDEVAAVAVITVRSHPPNAGMSSVQVVPAIIPLELLRASKRLIGCLGYRGHGSVQFIERDRRFYVHDVNLRLPSSVALSMLAGLDMPRLAVEVALGLGPELGSLALRPGVRYVWLHGELQTLLGRIERRESIPRIWEVTSDILLAGLSPRRVLDEFVISDPLPAVALLAREMRQHRRRARTAEGRRAEMPR